MALTTVQALLAEAARARDPAHDMRDAELLLAHVLGKPRSFIRAWPEHTVSEDAAAQYRALLVRRRDGEPIAYLTGEREFWSLPLRVTRDTLVPRPETELLVERALHAIPADARWRVLDLGTGAGPIALAVASERPLCTVTATETSPQALRVARGNALQLGVGNVRFAAGAWWDAVGSQRFHVVLANPPYVADDDPHLQQGDLPAEPRLALAAGPDGLRELRAIIAGAPAHLDPPGVLIVEHGHDQQGAVHRLLAAAGFTGITCHRDLAGLDRASEARLKSEVDNEH